MSQDTPAYVVAQACTEEPRPPIELQPVVSSQIRAIGYDAATETLAVTFTRQGDLTVSDARLRVLEALRKFGVLDGDAIVSTNLQTRLDGLPRSGQAEPRDPGVAVYWVRPLEPMRCMAIDRYDRVADNLTMARPTPIGSG